MPGTSKAKNKRGIEITFVEDTHKYSSIINGKEIIYTSGTTFVSRFFPKFDPDGKIAERVAINEGVSVDEIKRRWKEKGEKSCLYGTRVHETIEDRLLGRTLRHRPENDREKLVFENIDRLSENILKNMDVLGIEKIIFDENLKIAGTIDLLARSKKTGKLFILDHKSNEKIDTENKFGKYGLHPIEHIIDTNFGHYQMQLNLYKYILLNSGYFPKDEDIKMCLFHITESGNKTLVIKNFQNEIYNMMKVYKENNFT